MDTTPLGAHDTDDIIRFNEAIDQAVAESVGHFHAYVERGRNLLLGMLGHDMRSPLNTIVMTASHLAALNAGEQVSMAAARLIRSGTSMRALLDDLVDFNRTTLGLGLRIVPSDIDLASVLADEVEPWALKYPTVAIRRAVLSGSVAEGLIRAGTGARLLVVGDKRRGVVSRARTGDIPRTVAADAPCPVAAVPLGRHGDEQR